jgi:hypothetical protein
MKNKSIEYVQQFRNLGIAQPLAKLCALVVVKELGSSDFANTEELEQAKSDIIGLKKKLPSNLSEGVKFRDEMYQLKLKLGDK